MSVQKVLTKDGSYTLFNKDFGEHYHSLQGAVAESNHVFIHAGLKFMAAKKPALNILEAGLGTGLNALLALQFSIENSLKVSYTSLELFPLDYKLIQSLQLPQAIQPPEIEKDFRRLHIANFDERFDLKNHFSFVKHKIDISEYQSETKF